MGRRPVKVRVKSVRTRLIDFFGARARIDVVAQQVLDHEAGIFRCVKENDLAGTLQEIAKDPQCLRLRDSVGAAPVHVAFLYGHFELGREIVRHNKADATLTYSMRSALGESSPYEGENILHLAIVHRQRHLVYWLLQEVPELVQAETVGKFFRPGKTCYFGGTPLLFALSSNQIDMALDILDAGQRLKFRSVVVNRTAPQIIKQQTTRAKTEAELETTIFECDRFGNNALHMAVVHDLPNVYNFALLYAMHELSPKPAIPSTDARVMTMEATDEVTSQKEERRQERLATFHGSTASESLVDFIKRVDEQTYDKMTAFLLQRNSDDLTPLSLAAALGNQRMFQHVLKHATSVSWCYGPITALAIPLRDLEQPLPRDDEVITSNVRAVRRVLSCLPPFLAPNTTSSHRTAIQCLCSVERLSNVVSKHSYDLEAIVSKRLEILRTFEVKQLVRKKWKYVGKQRFMTRFVLYLVFLTMLNVVTMFKQSYLDDGTVAAQVVLGVLEAACLLMCFARFLSESHQILLNFRGYVTEAGAGRVDNICTLVVSVCMFLCTIMRAIGVDEAEDACMAVALVFAWFYLFFFLLGFRTTGPFVIMILNMVSNDIVRFMYVYVAVMAGFSQAVYLVQDGRVGAEQLLHRVRMLVIAGFTGEVNYDDNYTSGRMNALTQLMMLGYIVLVMILLVNLLIAMMGNTYNQILAEAEQRWFAERANLMASIEQQSSRADNDALRRKYAIPLQTRAGKPEELYLQLEINNMETWKKQISQDDA